VTGRLTGACHCGAVTVGLPAAPDYLGRCNCTLCTKTGAVWGYYHPADVTVTGALDGYVRADMAEPCLSTDRCRTCGCIVRWHAIIELETPRMGINMNLFAPEDIAGIEFRHNDGRSWPL
jgi:hypothetical protein